MKSKVGAALGAALMLTLGASIPALADGDEVAVEFYADSDLVPAAVKIASERYAVLASRRRGLRDGRYAIQLERERFPTQTLRRSPTDFISTAELRCPSESDPRRTLPGCSP